METDPGAPRTRYSTVAITLHWTIALLVIGNLAGGLLVGDFLDSPDKASQAIGVVVIDLHKSIGLTVLLLTLVRIGWRLANPPPPLPAHMTRAEAMLARAVHLGFYALLLLIPFSGWAFASTDKIVYPLIWFWLLQVPHLPLPQRLGETFGEAHEWLAWGAIALLVLHIGAVVKHWYFDRDNLLARIWPARH